MRMASVQGIKKPAKKLAFVPRTGIEPVIHP